VRARLLPAELDALLLPVERLLGMWSYLSKLKHRAAGNLTTARTKLLMQSECQLAGRSSLPGTAVAGKGRPSFRSFCSDIESALPYWRLPESKALCRG
jgi:hypothetical protein